MYYDQSPQFGFTASSMPGLPTTLDSINPAYFNQIASFIAAKGGRLASITGIELYDTLRVDAGILPTRDFVFFQTPVGNLQGLFVAGTQYTKQEIDIHPWIVNGGQLATGYEALIWGIGVQFHIVEAQDTSLQIAPINALNLALDPGQLDDTGTTASTAPAKMANLLRAFQESLNFTFFINQTFFESGPGWRFPAGLYGMSGQNSIASSTATLAVGPLADGFVNNGLGWTYQMPVMRHLPSLTKFGIRMQVQNPFTTANVGTVRIVVTLSGIGIQPVTG